MTSYLFGAKPLSEPIVDYCLTAVLGTNVNLKCRGNGGHFSSLELIALSNHEGRDEIVINMSLVNSHVLCKYQMTKAMKSTSGLKQYFWISG